MKVNAMLKVVSILYIVFATIAAVGIVLAVSGGALLGAAAGNAAAGTVLFGIMMIPAVISVVLELLAGINGVRGAHLSLCTGLGVTILVLGAISLMVNVVGGSNIIGNIAGIVLSVLYLTGVSKQRSA